MVLVLTLSGDVLYSFFFFSQGEREEDTEGLLCFSRSPQEGCFLRETFTSLSSSSLFLSC